MSETPKVEPLSADDLAMLRIVHAPREREIEVNDCDGSGWKIALAWVCDDVCEVLWPCETARLLATLDAVLKAARIDPEAAVEHLACAVEAEKAIRFLREHNARIDALLGNDSKTSNGSIDACVNCDGRGYWDAGCDRPPGEVMYCSCEKGRELRKSRA